MRFFRLQAATLIFAMAFAVGLTALTFEQTAYAQETTGGFQGTVKDPSGAVVPVNLIVQKPRKTT